MTDLPEGWAETSLEEIARDVTYGYTAKSNRVSGGAKMLRITDIQDNRVDWSQVPFCAISEADKSKYLLKKWDLVFARTGATVGKSFLIQDDVSDAVFASYLIRVRCLDQEMTRYLSFFFNSPAYWDQITDFSAGIGQPNVNGSKLKALTIPLAPLAEQKRIADRLAAVLGRVDACRARLDRVPALLKRFRQSVLASATSGGLTEEWRNDNGLTCEWKATTTDDLFEFVTSGSRGWAAHYSDTGAVFLRVGNLNHDDIRLDLREIQHVSPPVGAEGRRTLVRPHDILISITADVGMVALVPDGIGEAYINQHVALARPSAGVDSRFLAWFLASKPTKDQWKAMQRGATKVGLSLGDIRSITLGLPSPEEQQEIVRRVDALFAIADRMEARLATARKTVERLTPATLAKAFRGELVPQDPNDEPASALLERLRGSRGEASSTKPKRGRRSIGTAS
jgi:type I restriction enzyme S subunit